MADKFIDLTEVLNNNQRYITIGLSHIVEIHSEDNVIVLDNDRWAELTDESMQKLLDVMEDNSLIVGTGYGKEHK